MKKLLAILTIIFVAVTALTVVSYANTEYVFDANDLNCMVAEKSSIVKTGTTTSDGKTYLRITSSSQITNPSNTFIRFDIFDEAPLFNVDEFPFVAVAYKTNIPMQSDGMHINAGMKITDDDTYVRCWGLHVGSVNDGSRALAIYDVRSFSGIPDNGEVGYADIDPSAGIKFVRIPPWAKATGTTYSDVRDDYFDIEYIGFFQSRMDAGLYFEGDIEYTVTYYDKFGNVYQTEKVNSYTMYEPIDGPEVDGFEFTGWVNSSGTAVPESFRMDTNYEFFPTYKYSLPLDCYVYPAGHLKARGSKMTASSDLISEKGSNWVRFTVSEDGVHDNSNAITFTCDISIPAHDYKYVAIKYKSNISTARTSAVSSGLKYKDQYYRFWGLYPTFYGDGEEHLMVVSIANITGGDAKEVKSLSDIDADSGIEYIRLTPWGQPNTSIKVWAGEYIDIAYIGFFKNAEDAQNYSLSEESILLHKPFMELDSVIKFNPDNNLTRGDAASIITRIITDINKISYLYESSYSDIDYNDDCYSSVAYLENIGYLEAKEGTFNPDEPIDTSDLVELINKAAEDFDELSAVDVEDISTEYITRAEAAELFCKLLGRVPTKSGISYVTSPGPIDVPKEHPSFAYILEACYAHKYMLNWDDTELWTYVNDNNFYMKKAPDGIIEQLNDELANRAEEILSTESEWTLASGGRMFYVSNKGSDLNDGLSESSPIATIGKVHELQNNNTIIAGDVVLFERGGEWYPTESLNENGEIVQDKYKVKAGVTVSAYGTGDKPRILGSVNASGASNWSKVEGYDDLYVFNKKIGDDLDVGNIVFNDGTFTWEGSEPVYTNGSAFGMRLILDPNSDHALQAGHDGDSGNGDFIVSNGPSKWVFNTEDYIFTKSTDLQAIADAIPESDLWYHHNKEDSRVYLICKRGNPGEVFEKIDLCTKVNTIRASSNVTLDNLCIKFTGSHGVGAGSCENLVIRNCEVGFIGGSIQGSELSGETGRFGNAIEIYGKANGFYVYDCFIYQCFDCGPTVQVGIDELTWGNDVIQKDVHFYGNALWNAALEVWLSTNQPNFGKYHAALINCKMYDNLVAFNGYGFQGYTHQKHDYCGFYGAGTTYADYIDCTMENNTFWNLRMNILKATPTSVNDGDGIYWKNNTIIHEYDKYLGLLGENLKDATGRSVRHYYNNATVKKLISEGAFGYNEFLYLLPDGAEDPAESRQLSENGIVSGDANGDGEQSAQDLIVFSRYLAKWNGYIDRMNGANSDLNGDKQLTSLDLVILARRLANWVGYTD